MAQLGAWLMVAATISIVLRRRPVVTVAIALALWILLPAVAARRVVGSASGPLAVHPSTWLMVVQIGVCLVVDARRLVIAANRHILIVVTSSMFIVGAVAASVLNGRSGVRILADQIVGPLIAFALIVAYSTIRTSEVTLLRWVIVGLGAAESLFVVLQSAVGRTILYENDYSRLYWFRPDRFDRWMGTTDHPLVLSMLISTAAILTIGLNISSVTRAGLLLVLSLGVVTTQSRVGVAIVGCALVYFVFSGRINIAVRIVCLAAAAVSARAVLSSSLVTGVSSRLSDDTGSNAARRQAFEVFFDNIRSVAWAGQGLTSNYDFARAGGLQTSLESSFMMYAVDVGLPLAVLYFGTQLLLVLRHSRGNQVAGAVPAALVAMSVQHTFSALGYANMTGFLVWSVIGMAVVGSGRLRPKEETPQLARRSASMSSRV